MQRPDAMYRAGREIDDDFSPDEPLYLRVRAEQVDGNRLIEAALGPITKSPRFSVNRGKGGEPLYVLYPSCDAPANRDYSQFGVAQFSPADLPDPSALGCDGCADFTVSVEHDPCEDNYFHAEVRSRKHGHLGNEAPKTLRNEIRRRIASKGRVAVPPPAGSLLG